MANQTSLAKQNYSGLDLEKKSRLRRRAEFFLDIPFNRTAINPWGVSAMRSDCDSMGMLLLTIYKFMISSRHLRHQPELMFN